MQPMTLSQLAISCGGTLMHPDCCFEAVSIDSRQLQPGELFVALTGERFDAHQFLPEVSQKACGLVVEKPFKEAEIPQWVVPDTTIALGQLAHLHREQFDGPIIGITGSSGKTTVKEMLAAILSQGGAVLATKGNLNNHIGVPLTLLNLQQQHRYGVIEMGASGHGEIRYLCSLALPDVVLINNVLPAHVEGFGSLEGIAKAKGEIYQGVNAAGTAVINLDEPFAADWMSRVTATNTLTYSISREDADFRALNVQQDAQGCCQFELLTPAGQIAIYLPISGQHNVANALAAAACASAVGAGLEDISQGLQKLAPVSGRLSLHASACGATVLDDSYNANPGSMKAAIDTLMSFSPDVAVDKILVMGDMAELGQEKLALHAEVGRYAAEKGVKTLLATGELSRQAVASFTSYNNEQGGSGVAQAFDSKETLVAHLKALLAPASVVLVKGSRSAAMEEVVQALIKSGEQ